MPSVRPKLVQEGAPIATAKVGGPVKSDDVATKGTADNLYVIGGGTPPAKGGGQQKGSSLNNSRSSLSMHASLSSGMDASLNDNNSSRGKGSRRGSGKKGTSSLLRAAKGTFIQDKKPKKKQTVQTTFVVGGGSGSGGAGAGGDRRHSHQHQDEKKSADMADDNSGRRSSFSRPTVISTSYQIPDNGHASFSSLGGDNMDMETSARGTRRKSRTSTVQPTAYVIGGPPAQVESNNNNNNNNNSNDNDDTANAMDTSNTMDVTHTMDVTPTSPTTVAEPTEEAKPEDDDKHKVESGTEEVEKMEGVIDLSEKPPLCVLDGANLAYAYAKAGQGGTSLSAEQAKPEPDTKGIEVAVDYFESAGIRVLAVLPQTWTLRENHQKVLKKLEEKGVLVEAPSRDDDDAYAITIARREDAKAQQRGDGPGYVMSNDMFRDAAARSEEEGGGDDLKVWLTEGSTLESGKTGPGRISFAFLDTGSIDDHGDKVLDIMPNPRHPLIQFVERTRTTAAADQ